MVSTFSQSQLSACILIYAADGISTFIVALVYLELLVFETFLDIVGRNLIHKDLLRRFL